MSKQSKFRKSVRGVKSIFLLLAIFSKSFFSCGVISFERLDTEISIAENADYYNGENIEVFFSSKMLHPTVEKIITLKKDGAKIETEFIWQNERCLVKPIGGFIPGCAYDFSLRGQARTADEREYSVAISRKFIFGEKEKNFILEEFFSPKESDAALEFRFNKEIDVARFEQEFKISPYIQANKEFSFDKKIVKIIPKDKWQNNTFYTWTLENIFSADGYKIHTAYSENFMAANEHIRPQVICVCPVILNENMETEKATFLKEQSLSALRGKQPLGIIFSKPMDFNSVKNALYFEANLGGVLLKVDEYKFIYAPYENYKIGQEYLLTIDKSAKDIFGLEMQSQKNFYFSSDDDFLKITSIETDSVRLQENCITEIYVPDDGTLFLKIQFSSDISSRCHKSIESAIRLGAFFPNSANPAKLNSIRPNGKSIVLCWNNLSKDCIYELKILGGKNYLANDFDEYLEEEKCFYLKIK